MFKPPPQRNLHGIIPTESSSSAHLQKRYIPRNFPAKLLQQIKEYDLFPDNITHLWSSNQYSSWKFSSPAEFENYKTPADFFSLANSISPGKFVSSAEYHLDNRVYFPNGIYFPNSLQFPQLESIPHTTTNN